MLLAAIDESHKSTYDFIYLPIDFKVVYFFHLLIFFDKFIQNSPLISKL